MDGDGRLQVNLRSRPFWSSFKTKTKEMFLPDDPFRQVRRQRSVCGKTWKALQYFLPILEWAPRYSLKKLRYDALAGITLASLTIPQGISYARLADLPPIIGIYSSFVPPLIYAVFGSSKDLAVGTVAAASLMLASMIGGAVDVEENPGLYLHLMFTAAFFTGIYQAFLGFFRLGFLVDFLSRSTIIGFMGGTAVIIILQQLKGILGLRHFTTKTDLISVLKMVLSQTHEWSWRSSVLGLCFLGFLLATRHLKAKKPTLFWVYAISPLVVVIAGGIFAYLVKGETLGISTVGPLKKGLNPLSAHHLQFGSQYLMITVKAGIITGTIALAEGIAVGRSFAMLKNDQIDGNKEMIAFGLMNIAGSMTSCYLTTGPFSKTAVNFNAGCQTAMSNAIMSGCMVLVLLFLAPLFQYTPLVALSAIIVTAMIGLVEYEKVVHLFRVDKFDFCICMVAFLGVMLISMDVGLMMSVGLAILRALLYVARPDPCKLGFFSGTALFRDTRQYAELSLLPGVLIIQPGSPIYFANSGYLRERIFRWIDEEVEATSGRLQHVIFDIGGVASIDTTGIEMLQEVTRILRGREITVALVNPRIEVANKLVISSFIEELGRERIFLSIENAVRGCRFRMHEAHPNVVVEAV